MELATFEKDHWQLRNGEEAHRNNPESFWIPEIGKRKNLKIGDAAKLIFDIECEDEDGGVVIEGERGFVIVSEIAGDKYIGILDFQPACIDKDDSKS